MFVAIMAVNSLNYFAPLVLLGGAHFLTAFKTDQMQALALVSLGLYSAGYGISLVFFGFHCLLIGYLILRSAFLPRILGVLMAITGWGWLTFLSPPLANYLWPYIAAASVLGEGSLTLWLLVLGVNVQRWKEQASAA
jgi:hypothetical protein